jgi:hypothetical protein
MSFCCGIILKGFAEGSLFTCMMRLSLALSFMFTHCDLPARPAGRARPTKFFGGFLAHSFSASSSSVWRMDRNRWRSTYCAGQRERFLSVALMVLECNLVETTKHVSHLIWIAMVALLIRACMPLSIIYWCSKGSQQRTHHQ